MKQLMYGVIHMDGSGDTNPPIASLPELYDELLLSGIFDGNVSVINDESGWAVSAHRDGRLVFEHLGGEGSPQHMKSVPKERVVELWKLLIAGDLDAIRSDLWIPGYTD